MCELRLQKKRKIPFDTECEIVLDKTKPNDHSVENLDFYEVVKKQPNDIIALLTNKGDKESLPIGVFSKEIIDKYDISIVTQQEAIEKVNMTSIITVMQLMEDLVLKNRKEIEKCGQ